MANITVSATIADFMDSADATAARAAIAAGTVATTESTLALLADDLDLRYSKSIVGLTGGGATKLDGIITAGVGVGRIVDVVISGIRYPYILAAGTMDEVSPDFIRPDDYNASTNAKVWKAMAGWKGNSVTRGTVARRDPDSGYVEFEKLGINCYTAGYAIQIETYEEASWIAGHIQDENVTVAMFYVDGASYDKPDVSAYYANMNGAVLVAADRDLYERVSVFAEVAGIGGVVRFTNGLSAGSRSSTNRIDVTADEASGSRTHKHPDVNGVVCIVPPYTDLTAANAALASGDFFWDTTLKKLRVATA